MIYPTIPEIWGWGKRKGENKRVKITLLTLRQIDRELHPRIKFVCPLWTAANECQRQKLELEGKQNGVDTNYGGAESSGLLVSESRVVRWVCPAE